MNAANLAKPEVRGAILAGTPLRRLGQPGEMVGALLSLCSGDAAWTTGSLIVVDGGFVAWSSSAFSGKVRLAIGEQRPPPRRPPTKDRSRRAPTLAALSAVGPLGSDIRPRCHMMGEFVKRS